MSKNKKEKIKKTNAARLLDELGIEYDFVRYDVDEEDLSAVRAASDAGIDPSIVYKTLVARGEVGVVEAVIDAAAELDLKALASVCRSKSLSMVHVKELPDLTGYIRGGCSPLGCKKKYPVVIDERAKDHDRIAVNAGERGLMMLIAPAELARAAGAVFAPITRVM